MNPLLYIYFGFNWIRLIVNYYVGTAIKLMICSIKGHDFCGYLFQQSRDNDITYETCCRCIYAKRRTDK